MGIYVHIPFCVRKCPYCDFVSGPLETPLRRAYLKALGEEIRNSPLVGRPAVTLFLGGGTPSELTKEELTELLSVLIRSFPFPSRAEWTLECNPGTLDPAFLLLLRDLGFNRISLGVQSFQDRHLRRLGRIHDASTARAAVELVRRAGFENLNLDLLFGLPEQTLPEWRRDLLEALSFSPEHLSLYQLTIEEKTPFGAMAARGLLPLPAENLAADMYELALDLTAASGYRQYEISNFSRPGWECRHNLRYWRNEPFIGFGVSAASYWEGRRWANTRQIRRYIASVGRGGQPEKEYEEHLEGRAAAAEAIMLALRTREGVSPHRIDRNYPPEGWLPFEQTARNCREEGLLTRRGESWVLTRKGMLLGNLVCGRFLEVGWRPAAEALQGVGQESRP